MVQPVVPKHKIILILSQEVLNVPQLRHVLPGYIGSYTILSTSYKLVGGWYGIYFGVRRSYTAPRVYFWTQIRIFWVHTQGASLICSSRVVNWG